MPNEVTRKEGTQILFNLAASYNPATALNDIEAGTPTDVAWTPDGVLTNEARMSVQADLGANRAAGYAVTVAMEWATAPVAGETYDIYWAASPVSTAGTGNPGYVTGTDVDYTGTPGTLAEGLAQLIFVGSLVCSVDANIQVQVVNGYFSPPHRYGSLVGHNNTSDTTGDSVESAVAFDPIIDEVA